MVYIVAIVGLALCAQGLLRISVGVRAYIDEVRRGNPGAATQFGGLGFVSGWGVLLIGIQMLLFVFSSDLNLGRGSTPLWPGIAGVLSLGIAFVWGLVMKRAVR